MDIIYLPFKNEYYFLDKITSGIYFTRVLKSCYSTLTLAIQEYRPSELYASQWLQFIISHSIETTLENNINAGLALKELIDNNKTILEYRINKEIILKFIEILATEKNRDSRYVSILRAICICNNEAMIHNQNMLSNLILIDEITKNGILVPVKISK